MLHKGFWLLVCHTKLLVPHLAQGLVGPWLFQLFQQTQEQPAPGALAPSHPPCLSRTRLQRHKTSKSHFILGDTIQRNARNFTPRDNLSLFSPNDTRRCEELWDGILTWDSTKSRSPGGREGRWAGWVLGELGDPRVVAAPYLGDVRAQNPHGCRRRLGRAVPVALGAGSAGDMAPGEGSQQRPAAPRPPQRPPRGGSTAGLSRIGPEWAPQGWGQGTGHPAWLRGRRRDEGTGGCAREMPAVSVGAQPEPPLPIISNSFLIYLNKQAALTSAEVFEQPGPG